MHQRIASRCCHALALIAGLCLGASRVALALDPYASVTDLDGTLYSYFRTEQPITAASASQACAALGGTLASLADAAQVRASLWSDPVVAAGSEQDTTLLWTGLKITWPNTGSGRRMLRATAHHKTHVGDGSTAAISHAEEPEELTAAAALQRRLLELEASGDALVPYTTAAGVPIPPMLRLWMHDKLSSQADQQPRGDSDPAHLRASGSRHSSRSLLAGAWGDGDESRALVGAVLTWEDGSDASFVKANPSNFGFLACTNKRKGCCGAVYDIGPDAYFPSEFPTVFLYPCDSTAITKSTAPSGYTCVFAPQLAELPKNTPPLPAVVRASSPPPAVVQASSPPPPVPAAAPCSPGSAPAKKGNPSSCKPCKQDTYSPDGSKCLKCPAGTKARKGATKCKKA